MPFGGRRCPAGLAAVAVAALATVAVPEVARAIDPERSLGDCMVEVWRAREGLPGAWIRGITQSTDGYLWIGTLGGVARYGGGNLVALTPPPLFERAGDVMGLAAGREGTIWIKPARGPPVCARGDGLLSCFAEQGAPPPETRTSVVEVDAAGVAWFATGAGIFRAAGPGGRPALVKTPAAWGGGAVTALHHDGRGRLWVGTGSGLFVGPDSGGVEQRLAAPPGVALEGLAIAALAGSRGGGLWVAAEGVLALIDARHTKSYAVRDGATVWRMTTVHEDRDGNVWIGAREGLIRLQPERGFVRFTRADGLPDDDVSALFEDREGSLWVGTRAGGLAQFTDRTLDRQSGPPSLRDLYVSSVAEDADGVVWAGSARGLTRWKDGEERTYTTAQGLPDENVTAVHPGRPGEIWVGTSQGLGRWRDGRAEVVAGIDGSIRSINTDGDAGWWVGSTAGLWRIPAAGGPAERFPWHPEVTEAEREEIRAVARDDQGTVWVSGNGRLLRLVDGQLRREPSPPVVAAMEKVRSMTRDGDGTLWMGTGDGLVRRRRGQWRVFGAAEGLRRGDLYQVAADDVGSLWVGVNHGVLRIARAALDEVERGQRRSVDVVSFEISDQRREVRVTRTRQPGVWKSRDGRLRFATGRGVVSVDPRRQPPNPLPPPVVIEQALVDGQPAQRGVANRFPPGSGALEFHYAAITLVDPRKAQHRYRLEGFDADWVEAGTRRVAYYTNIGPGHYRFRVQGSNADGVWNQAGDVLELTLAPHFYQSSWFFVLAALAALGLVLTFHRLRVARLRARYLATFAERARVARELHDSLLQGMAAALMHLRGLRKKFAPERAPAPPQVVSDAIKEIEELVATNIEETRQFVWDLRDQSSDAVDLSAALGQLVERLEPRRAGAADAGPAVEVVVEGTAVPVPRHVRRELVRIAHEAVTNALKHGRARQIALRLHYDRAAIRLAVCDDGQGFDPEKVAGVKTGHFGVTGMRERAEMLGRFQIDSQPGRGTKVEVAVNLEDLRDG